MITAQRLESARHEAAHALMAHQHRFEVEYCRVDGPIPETSVLFRMGTSRIRQEALQDPLSASYELQRMIEVATVNQDSTSPSDLAACWIWQSKWPVTAKPRWAMIERQAKQHVQEWLSFSTTQKAIFHTAALLALVGHLEGERLYRVLHHATVCLGFPSCFCEAMLGPVDAPHTRLVA